MLLTLRSTNRTLQLCRARQRRRHWRWNSSAIWSRPKSRWSHKSWGLVWCQPNCSNRIEPTLLSIARRKRHWRHSRRKHWCRRAPGGLSSEWQCLQSGSVVGRGGGGRSTCHLLDTSSSGCFCVPSTNRFTSITQPILASLHMRAGALCWAISTCK